MVWKAWDERWMEKSLKRERVEEGDMRERE
jgi:hypothetical protein